ncbi:MAG TPA: hypothetical protein VHK64_00565 [Nocardioidaceae bacterium]|nr:hypothetical protein [Nocardioidaceae bacterium]
MADAKAEPKKAEPTGSTTDPKPVGAAGRSTGGSTSLPLAGGAPLAGESSDPAVHQLLAERQALQMNRDTIDPPVDKDALKAVDEQLAEVDKKLADLGYAQPK